MGVFAESATGRRLARLLLGATGAVLSAFIVVFAVHRLGLTHVPDAKAFVDIGGENNLPTWWNGLLLFAVAAAATMAAIRSAARRAPWLVIAAAAGYLTLDELAQLHERMNGPVRATGLDLPTYTWLVPGAVIAAAGCAVLVRAARLLPGTIARRLGIALACYVAGAIGMEAVNGLFSPRWLDLELAFALGITVEEGLEMLACIIALTALVDHLILSAAPAPVQATGQEAAPA